MTCLRDVVIVQQAKVISKNYFYDRSHKFFLSGDCMQVCYIYTLKNGNCMYCTVDTLSYSLPVQKQTHVSTSSKSTKSEDIFKYTF